MKTISTLFLAALITITMLPPSFAAGESVKLGIILDTRQPLKVNYVDKKYKEKVQGAALGGLIGGLFVGGAMEKRNSDYATRLIATVGDSVDRSLEYKTNLNDVFRENNPNLELVFLPPSLVTKNKPNFKKIDKNATPYVLVVKETAGLATPALRWGSLAAHSHVDLYVYNTKNKKRILKEKIEAVGTINDDINAAVDSPETFKNGYPKTVRSVSYLTYWRLNGRNILHTIAKDTPFASEFPSIESLRAENAKRFDFVRPKIKGWRRRKTGTPYMFIAEPRKDKKKVAIVTDVDLLVKELGQDFETLAPYVDLRLSRLTDLGWNIDSIKDASVLVFEDEWQSYMLPVPTGGFSIFLHKKNVDFVISHQIIVLEENPIPLLEKYQSNIQDYVDESKLKIQ